jgi:aryl-alcohol dehydrogenase-like predicted oxidoreductase
MDLLGSNLNKFCLGLSQFNNSLYKKKKFLEKDILKFIKYAIRKNIHIFDTANNYGNTEVALGKLSKEEKKKLLLVQKLDI